MALSSRSVRSSKSRTVQVNLGQKVIFSKKKTAAVFQMRRVNPHSAVKWVFFGMIVYVSTSPPVPGSCGASTGPCGARIHASERISVSRDTVRWNSKA